MNTTVAIEEPAMSQSDFIAWFLSDKLQNQYKQMCRGEHPIQSNCKPWDADKGDE